MFLKSQEQTLRFERALVEHSEIFITCDGRRIVCSDPSVDVLGVFVPPIILPRGRIYMVFHARMQADAGHRWFRELSAKAAQDA